MYKKYIKITFSIILIFVLIISLINIFVDPGKIYMKRIVTQQKANLYIEKLLKSKNGLVRDGWNERLIKTTLAKKSSGYDCVILGSSHIMQISSIQKIGNIQKQCNTLLNLGVSGGGLEDIFMFSYFLFQNKKLPKKVFIGIDPWTLKYNMDSRYGAYENEYVKMNEILNLNIKNNSISYSKKVLKNLINWEYFYYSIKELKSKRMKVFDYVEKKIITPSESFKYSTGYKNSVILSDGAHIYSNAYLVKQTENNKNIPIGGGDYKIKGEPYEEIAVSNLIKLLELYQGKNVQINFIMTPYHPNVFKKGETNPVQHMKKVKQAVFGIAQKYHIKIYGSFFPKNLNCSNNEFLDFMHPTIECLSKIDFSY